jgi:hypothetical protein
MHNDGLGHEVLSESPKKLEMMLNVNLVLSAS